MTGQVGAATMLEFGLDGDLPCSPPPAVTGPPDFGLILVSGMSCWVFGESEEDWGRLRVPPALWVPQDLRYGTWHGWSPSPNLSGPVAIWG